VRGAARWRALDVAPCLRGCPPRIPGPGRSGPHSPSDAETPTAQGRRRCCGARRQRRPEGRAGLRRRRPAAFARSPSPGGVPSSRGWGSGALGSAPTPSREREGDALTFRAPVSREHLAGGGRPGLPSLHLDSESLNGGAGQCQETSLLSRGQSWAAPPPSSPILPGRGAARRSEGGIRILCGSVGTLPASAPQLRNQQRWGLFGEQAAPIPPVPRLSGGQTRPLPPSTLESPLLPCPLL
jgi:hypothetical protein